MNFQLTTLLRGAVKTARYLSFVLLPALSSEGRAGIAPQHTAPPRTTSVASARRSLPYLAVIGSPAIRIAETLGVLPEEPKLPEPPKPVVVEPPPPPVKHEEIRTEPVPPKVIETVVTATVVEPEKELPKGPPPVSILPDDTPRELRSEDVLPYFRYPGSVEPSQPPAPAPLPQSSATYQLK